MKLIWSIVVIILFGYGCKKHDAVKPMAAEIEVLKTWLKTQNGAWTKEVVFIKSTNRTDTAKLVWDSPKKYIDGGRIIYNIPYRFSNSYSKNKRIATDLASDELPMMQYLRFVVDGKNISAQLKTQHFKEADSNGEAFIIEQFYNINGGDYRGRVILGKNNYRIEPIKKKNTSEVNRMSICFSQSFTRYSIEVTGTDAHPIVTYYKFTRTYSYGDCDGGGTEEVQIPQGDTAGGGGPNDSWDNYTEEVQEVLKITPDTSITNNAIVNCIYEKLMSSQLQKGMSNILSAFNGNAYNLQFKLGTFSNPNTHGSQTNTGNNFLITINRTEALNPAYPRTLLVKTFIHEAFHAKLKQKAIELLPDYVEQWPININDMDLQELMFYFQSGSTSDGTWNSVGHAWMLNHINLCAESLQEFVQKNYPNTYNNLSQHGLKPYISLFYEGLTGVTFIEDDKAARGLDQSQIEAFINALFVFNCPQ